jgi:oligoribonuclease NrnB/cAMP/cGMP phosphodiesterase (DHH superfamily)
MYVYFHRIIVVVFKLLLLVTTLPPQNVQPQEDQTVYLLDYAGPPGFAIKLAERVAKCIILDHHKTAAEHLTGPAAAPLPANLHVVFDMNRSGAMLALDYFKPEGLSPENIDFFKHIEDGDLWRWKIPGSKEFYSGFSTAGLNLDARYNPEIFDQLLAISPSKLIEIGTVELERQNKLIASAVERAHVVNLGGKKGEAAGWGQALAVFVDGELVQIRSPLGNALAAESSARGLRTMAAVVYKEPGMDAEKSIVKVSLRSVGETEDTTLISQAYGGGGHCNASAFLLEETEFESWKN